jgi:large subunit ribosomal protein L20
MPRAKSASPGAKRHQKVLKRARGYRGGRGKLYRTAAHATQKGLQHAYSGRKQKKRQFRSLWIVRIGAASRRHGLSYNRFMSGLRSAGVELNRKILADLAATDEAAFAQLAEVAKGAGAPAETTQESAPEPVTEGAEE